jgi:TPR repeat protein
MLSQPDEHTTQGGDPGRARRGWAWWPVLGWGLLAFLLLTIRFSPNWLAFRDGVAEVWPRPGPEKEQLAMERAALAAHSLRGYFVLRQVRDFGAEIDDVNHQIVRWRLLPPSLGRVLHLPDWMTLGLAHVGCLSLILALTRFALRLGPEGPGRGREAWAFAVVAGATAPFFTSMGWLGYYDSWLALALLTVVWSGRRRWVWLACLLAPWVDERFVLGLPLALVARGLLMHGSWPEWRWWREQALVPAALAVAYAGVRLHLGGTAGSQTMEVYLRSFVFGRHIPLEMRVQGLWQGLRFAWLPVLMVTVACSRGALGSLPRRFRHVLWAGVVATAAVGIWTALDMARSMVLLLPVVPLGWCWAVRRPWWRRHHVGIWLAAAALLVPAHHVVERKLYPVDCLWKPSWPLLHAQNNIGNVHAIGTAVPVDGAAAVRWFLRSAEHGLKEAQNNLGVLYQTGRGIPQDWAEAVRWFRLAADRGESAAQVNLGLMLASGRGVAKDSAEAVRMYRLAAEQGSMEGQLNLAVMYQRGEGVPKDMAEAFKWCERAARQRNVSAVANLGAMHVTGQGTPEDPAKGLPMVQWAAEQGNPDAQANLGVLLHAGKVMPRDTPAAMRWLRQAAEKGQPLAQGLLGVILVTGDGVPRDQVEGLAWMLRAAESGNPEAAANAALLLKELSADQVAEARRRAAQGVPEGGGQLRSPPMPKEQVR